MTQAFNPYLPSWEYIPDGEPHVFDGRLYVYGSHDRFGGDAFCLNDYVCWSADPSDLATWTGHPVIYRKTQDPRNADGAHAMWAPDVARGPDGRYYLYYCLDVLPEIAVAVCDQPAGSYEFHGFVRHSDGTILGRREGDIRQFDPGVLVDDDGRIWLFSGQGPLPAMPGRHQGRSEVSELEPDMLTLRTEPTACVPTSQTGTGTDFAGHEFFEGSSIRKVRGRYYFVYSSVNLHELCYATADRPDGPYVYGGAIVSNGDLGFEGRSAQSGPCYPIGNNHGGIEFVNGQWYVFFHRHTNGHAFSRQAMAERIEIAADGSIAQVPITSCGLNGGPLPGTGSYQARICCHLAGPDGIGFSDRGSARSDTPFVTQDGGDREGGDPQYVANLHAGATVGWKWFDLAGPVSIEVETRGSGAGLFEVRQAVAGQVVGEIPVVAAAVWSRSAGFAAATAGVSAVYLTYRGTGSVDLRGFTLA